MNRILLRVEHRWAGSRRAWRKASWAIGGAAFVAVAVGLGLLGFLLVRGGGEGQPSRHELAYFSSDGSLWVYDADSDSRRLLAQDGTCGRFPRLAWSPTGEVLACLTEDRIVLRDAAGALISQIEVPIVGDPEKTGGGLVDLYWSPTGANFAYLRQSPNGFAMMVADASGETMVDFDPVDPTVTASGQASYGFPLWSPDGERLVYRAADAGETRIFSLDSTSEEVFSRDQHPLAWAMNGEALIATQNHQPAEGLAYPAYEAWLLHLSQPELSRRLPVLDNGAEFWLAPDGEHAAYVTLDQFRADGLPGLGVIDLRTGEAKPIADSVITYGSDHIPAGWVSFSVDGQHVYWVGGDNAGYRAKIDGSGLTKLLEAEVADFSWSPDFSMILYTRFLADSTSLVVADGDGGNARVLATRAGTNSPFSAGWRPQSAP